MPTTLHVILDGDGCWPDIADKAVVHPKGEIQIAYLRGGTVDGLSPTVAIRIDLADGRVVFAETTLALFLSAAQLFEAKQKVEAENS